MTVEAALQESKTDTSSSDDNDSQQNQDNQGSGDSSQSSMPEDSSGRISGIGWANWFLIKNRFIFRALHLGVLLYHFYPTRQRKQHILSLDRKEDCPLK